MGLDVNQYRVEALPTITRPSLTRWKDIVDQFVEVGCRAIFLRKLDPFGFAAKSAKTLGYSMDEFLEFYANAVDYIIELNRQGVQVMERHAAIMLNKILADEEPNYLDLRIPGGACIGQLGYAPDGSIYSSDEGRFVASMGDDMFSIGTVNDSYHELMTNAATRALVMAGLNDGQPDCVSCVVQAVVRPAGRVQLQDPGQPARAHARLDVVQEAQVDLRLPDAQARIGRRARHGDVPALDDQPHARSLHHPVTGAGWAPDRSDRRRRDLGPRPRARRRAGGRQRALWAAPTARYLDDLLPATSSPLETGASRRRCARPRRVAAAGARALLAQRRARDAAAASRRRPSARRCGASSCATIWQRSATRIDARRART